MCFPHQTAMPTAVSSVYRLIAFKNVGVAFLADADALGLDLAALAFQLFHLDADARRFVALGADQTKIGKLDERLPLNATTTRLVGILGLGKVAIDHLQTLDLRAVFLAIDFKNPAAFTAIISGIGFYLAAVGSGNYLNDIIFANARLDAIHCYHLLYQTQSKIQFLKLTSGVAHMNYNIEKPNLRATSVICMFYSNNFRSQRHDFHEVGLTKLSGNRSEYTGPTGILVGVDKNNRVRVKTD